MPHSTDRCDGDALRMRSAISVVREHGGTCRTRDLRAAGLGGRAIASAVASGGIERVRTGHYVTPDLAAEAKRAIRVGGRITCVSAAVAMGLRVLNAPDRLHVEVHEHDSRFRRPNDSKQRLRAMAQRPQAESPNMNGTKAERPRSQSPNIQSTKANSTRAQPEVRFHWAGRASEGGAWTPLVDVLAEVLGCVPEIEALCIIDSAREFVEWAPHLQHLDDASFAELIHRLPRRHRKIALRSSALSQAVGETVARERFRQAGITATPQVPLPGGYRADLLIGDRLIIECEGYDAHGDVNAFHRDRERAAWLRACGYTVLNFSHSQIVDDWPTVLSTTLLVMRRLYVAD